MACGDDEELPPLTAETQMSDAVMNKGSLRGTGASSGAHSRPNISAQRMNAISAAVGGRPLTILDEEEERRREEAPHGSVVRRLTAEEVAERNKRALAQQRMKDAEQRQRKRPTGVAKKSTEGTACGDDTELPPGVGMHQSPGSARQRGKLLDQTFIENLKRTIARPSAYDPPGNPPLYFMQLMSAMEAATAAEGKEDS